MSTVEASKLIADRLTVSVAPSADSSAATSPSVQSALGASDSAPGPPPLGGAHDAERAATGHAEMVTCDAGWAWLTLSLSVSATSPGASVKRIAASACAPLAFEPISNPPVGTCGAAGRADQ